MNTSKHHPVARASGSCALKWVKNLAALVLGVTAIAFSGCTQTHLKMTYASETPQEIADPNRWATIVPDINVTITEIDGKKVNIGSTPPFREGQWVSNKAITALIVATCPVTLPFVMVFSLREITDIEAIDIPPGKHIISFEYIYSESRPISLDAEGDMKITTNSLRAGEVYRLSVTRGKTLVRRGNVTASLIAVLNTNLPHDLKTEILRARQEGQRKNHRIFESYSRSDLLALRKEITPSPPGDN
jgi:hypothetical protein